MPHTRSSGPGGEDGEPSEPPPPPTVADVLARLLGSQDNNIEAALNTIAQNIAPGCQNRPGDEQHQHGSYQDFLGTHPPVFT